MNSDWRYNLQHMGDRFVCLIEAVTDAAMGSVTGVTLGYHILKTDKRKTGLYSCLGERVVELREDDPDLLSDDEKMQELFGEYDTVKETLDAYINEKEEIKKRIRAGFESCRSAGAPDEDVKAPGTGKGAPEAGAPGLGADAAEPAPTS